MYDSEKETRKHIKNVRNLIDNISWELYMRGIRHDRSKLEDPEKPIFDEYTPKLKDTTYNSEEYKQYLKEMKPALDHHYKNNRHHPEHFLNSYVNGSWKPFHSMNLVDIIEILCDWKAASLRHDDGDIRKSIEMNQKRFNYSDETKAMFLNTVDMFGW